MAEQCDGFGEVTVNLWDFLVIAVYFVVILVIGIWSSRMSSNRSTISGYFLAGRHMFWLPVGASVFASNIGSEHFVGLAGSGAAAGLGVAAFELNALIILQLLGWVFLPVYIAAGVHTIPEYMAKRFGGQRIRVYLALLSLVLYIFTKVSVNIYSGSVFVRVALGWSIWPAVLVILFLTALCTVAGGLTAVIYMDTFQCFLMLAGACVLSFIAFIKVGGYYELIPKYMDALPDNFTRATYIEYSRNEVKSALGKYGVAHSEIEEKFCGVPSEKAFNLLRRNVVNVSETFAQMLVQRTLSARSLSHAQGACLFAGLLKILPMFVIVLPGMIARVFYPNLLACEAIPDKCAQCCGNSVSCSNFAYPQLVMKLMPTGMRGIMLAGMLAALMSDLTSIFNSSATLFSLDIWHRARPKADSRELLIVGRVWVLVMVIAAVLWVPIVGEKQGGQLFIYIQHIAADLAPPIAAVYLMAILWKRTNETGAFTGLMVGAIIGVVRMLLEFTYPAPQCPNPDLRPFVVRLQYMYFALVLFVTSAIVTVVVSLFTEPVEKWRLIRTTYWTRKDQTVRPDIYEYAHNNPKINSNIHSGKESTDKMDMETFHFDVSSVPIGNKVEKSEDVITVKPSYFTSFYSWLCGLESVQMSADAENAMLKSEMKISKLEQDPMAKTLLNIGLVAIISLDIFLYVFFSTYSPIEA